MPDNTPKLVMPYIVASQAQKEVSHNEALNILDVLVQPVCLALDFTPPGSPAQGDTYIISGGTATGAWVGFETYIAAYYDTWIFIEPKEGWAFKNLDDDSTVYFNGTGWEALAAAGQFEDGTEALPAITFGADPNTGIYRIGADDIGITTNGTLRLRIDGTGTIRMVGGSIALGDGTTGEEALINGVGNYTVITDAEGNARIHIGQASGDRSIYIDLTTNDGSTFLRVRDSDDNVVAEIDSNGNLTLDGTITSASPTAQIPSLGLSWIGYGGGFQSPRYYKGADNLVTIEGLMQAGSDGTVFTLLAGYRPAADLMFCCWSGGGAYRVDVQADGDVVLSGSNSVFSSLSGIQFYAA